MKAYKIFLLLLVGIFTFASCEEEDTTPVLTQVEESSMNPLPLDSYVLTEPETGTSPLLFTLTWTETLFHLDNNALPYPAGPVTYAVQMDIAGNNFAAPQTIAGTTALSANIFVKDVNAILLDKMLLPADAPASVELRVVTSYGDNGTGTAISDNKITVSITPYAPKTDVLPIYIIGDMNGWNNSGTEFMMFREDNDFTNSVYTYTGYFGANTYFKIFPKEALGTWKCYCKVDDTKFEYILDGAAFYNELAGYKTLTINVKTMEYSFVEYDMKDVPTWDSMGFLGHFNDWGNGNSDVVMTKSAYDPHQWSVVADVTLTGYGVKFRANFSWDTKWCPILPENNPYGRAIYNNPVDNNINIGTQGVGTYDVRFNDITGHYYLQVRK